MTRQKRELSVGGKVGLAVGAGSVGIGLAALVAAVSLASYVARVVITPPRKREEDILVLGVTADTITLSVTKDSLVRGNYGFWFAGDTGYARFGEILSTTEEQVIRRLLGVDRGDLAIARRGRLGGAFYLDPRELGYAVEDVSIETPLGLAPAWLIPASKPTDDWVIQVHGRGVIRTECIRAVPVFHEAGYTSLLISYRNDGLAPDSEDRRYALGGTEWRDVEAAIEFALGRGAKSITLMGWSMGGATSLQASIRSKHRSALKGLVLESPVVDWRSVLDFQAAAMKVPYLIRLGALAILGSRWGRIFTGQSQPIDLDSLNLVERAHELNLPTLLLHSADDGYVPVDASRSLAVLRPDLVTYEEFTEARHAKLWNYDPERFNATIRNWLAAPSARTASSPRRAAAD